MIDVRISWLQSFVAVAEEHHFGRAAARVGHSASAVSRHIRSIEIAIGRPLFERTTRTVALTAAGHRLYREVATSVDTMTRALDGRDGRTSPIAIGYVGAAAEHLVPNLTWDWAEVNDDELQLVPASSGAQLEAILGGTMDLGLQWAGPREPGLTVTRVLTEPMRAALPATDRRAGDERVDLGDLAGETWLVAADRTDRVVRDHFVEICGRHGFTPRFKDAATGHAAQLHLVASGHGVCLVPPTAIAGCRLALSFVVLDGVSVDLVAVTRPGPRRAVQELVDLLARTASLEPRAA